jgi:hypothetical protein
MVDGSRLVPAVSCPAILRGNNSQRAREPDEGTPMTNPRQAMQEVQRMADRVCVLILSSDLSAIDIEIEKSKVRERCLELYPDREQLYEMIYESRFQRFWEQFRGEGEEP